MRADVDAWFARRSWHAEVVDAATLAAQRGGTTVAVVLPALDEERTVGEIVAAVHRDLVQGGATAGVPLVDELVVVDSGSTDATAQRAADAGARVVRGADVLPHLPPRPGKGEALWRGLAATTADIVVFVDSDLEDFTCRFVTGLLGPLLTDPGVHLVKATYDRPLRQGEQLLPAGGGRVTELVARPLLNLCWPQLAGFVQPLSGEYAGRRALLERLPFPTGYGVEIGLLVDALGAVGLDGLAQVDLASRKHRNQADEKLGRMASEIVQVVFERLRREGRLSWADGAASLHSSLTQFVRDGTGYLSTDTDLTPHERPPLATVLDTEPVTGLAMRSPTGTSAASGAP